MGTPQIRDELVRYRRELREALGWERRLLRAIAGVLREGLIVRDTKLELQAYLRMRAAYVRYTNPAGPRDLRGLHRAALGYLTATRSDKLPEAVHGAWRELLDTLAS